jgi:hypothetical protein
MKKVKWLKFLVKASGIPNTIVTLMELQMSTKSQRSEREWAEMELSTVEYRK